MEDFIVVDEEDAALYITPKKESKAAKLVSTPLPYSFEVVPGDTNSVVLDVISGRTWQRILFWLRYILLQHNS